MNYSEVKELIRDDVSWVHVTGELTVIPTEGMPEVKHWPVPSPTLAANINGTEYVAYRVHPVPASLGFEENVDVIAEDGSELGVLCLTSRLHEITLSTLTLFRRLALITDAPKLRDPTQHRFTTDYLVLRRDKAVHYFSRCADTSGLWGGFVHAEPPSLVATLLVKEITARVGLTLPRAEHKEALRRACTTDWTFYRFLKMYHLLELQLDLHLHNKILALKSDLHGFSKLMTSFSSSELDRINSVLGDRINYLPAMAATLQTLDWGNATLVDIIYFREEAVPEPFRGKAGLDVLRAWTTSGYFEWAVYKAGSRANLVEEQHRKKVLAMVAFIIYRFRCCIAHFRIGEYVLRESEESVVVSFGEPVLKEALRQLFGP